MAALSVAAIMALAASPACSASGMMPAFWPAVVRQEAHDPLALHDDTAHVPLYPTTATNALELARRLMQLGHSVGVGLSQLTARSEAQFERKFGIKLDQAFDPCTNMRVGAEFYVRGALSIYNTGRPDSPAGQAYARRVLDLASIDSAPAEPVGTAMLRVSNPCPPTDDDGLIGPTSWACLQQQGIAQ